MTALSFVWVHPYSQNSGCDIDKKKLRDPAPDSLKGNKITQKKKSKDLNSQKGNKTTQKKKSKDLNNVKGNKTK